MTGSKRVQKLLVWTITYTLVFPVPLMASPEDEPQYRIPGFKATRECPAPAASESVEKPADDGEGATGESSDSAARKRKGGPRAEKALPKPLGEAPEEASKERPAEPKPQYRKKTERGGDLVQPLPQQSFKSQVQVIDMAPIEAGYVVASSLPVSDTPRPPFFHPEHEKLKIDPRHAPVLPDPRIPIQDASAPDTPPSTLVSPAADVSPDAPPGPGTTTLKDADICDTGGVPPDLELAAGPTRILTAYNSAWQIRNKTGGLIRGFVDYVNMFTGRPNCGAAESSTNFLTDPELVYDDQNDRWVHTILRVNTTTNNSWLCLACSQTGDPNGAYNTYEIAAPASRVADYPHTGVGEDAIFIGTNNFTSTAYDQGMAVAVQKAAAYSGGAIAPRSILLGANAYTPMPTERRGFQQAHYPPAGFAHIFMVTNGSSGAGEVWRWTQPTFTTGTMTRWGTLSIPFVGNVVDPTGTFVNPSTRGVDGGSFAFLDAEVRWTTSTTGKLWTARTQGSGGFDVIQWAEINLPSGIGNPSLGQNGTYSIGSKHLFYPDVTVDASNNFGVGISLAAENGAGADDFLGAWVTGREGSTPANTLESAVVSHAGEQVYTSSETGTAPFRWGDYLGMDVDPNGCDMWFIGEYSDANTGGCPVTAGMWLRQWRFPSCSTNNSISLDASEYVCNDSVTVTVSDVTPVSAAYLNSTVSVTSTRPDLESTSIAWTCTAGCAGGNGTTWTATIPLSNSAGANNDGTLNVAANNQILASYADTHPSHGQPSASAVARCTLEVCYYLVDPLTGGCDGDVYHDNGEVLVYDVAIANFDTLGTNGPILADLRVKAGTDPNGYIQITNGTAYFDDLPNGFYEYALIPFKVRYTGPLATTCGANLQFEVFNIRSAAAGAWTSANCFVDPGAFAFVANLDTAARTAVTTYNFDANLQGWVDQDSHGSTTPECAGGGACGATNPYTNGSWVYSTVRPFSGAGSAFIDHGPTPALICSDSGLISPSTNFFSQFISEVGFRWWASIDFNNATTTWDGVVVEGSGDNGATWSQLALTPNYPGYIANYTCTYGPPFPNYQNGGNTLMLFGDGTGNTVANDTYSAEYFGDLAPFFTSTQGRVRFRSGSDDSFGGEGVYIDQVVFYTSVACETTVCAPAPNLQYSGFFDFTDTSCNNNGFLDPGETGVLQIYADNIGNDDAYNVVGTLSCPTCPAGVTICDNSATYGYVPYGSAFVYGAASNTFSIAITNAVTCATTLPFVVTWSGTDTAGNPYGPVVRSAPIYVGNRALRVEDHFQQDPAGTATTGRVGFSTPGWTESSATRVNGNVALVSGCSPNDGDGVVAQINGTGGGAAADFTRTFSTVGITSALRLHIEMQLALLDSGEQGAIQYTTNGSTWNDIRRVNGNGAIQAWNCYDVDMVAEFGAGVLNNANFGIRCVANAGGAAEIVSFDNFVLSGYSCASTTCTGACAGTLPPDEASENPMLVPFRMTKGAGTSVNFTYGPACQATSHPVYWGTSAGSMTGCNWTARSCAEDANGSGSFDPGTPAGSGFFYFVVVGANSSGEGSYGRDYPAGNPRPDAGSGVECAAYVTTGNCSN